LYGRQVLPKKNALTEASAHATDAQRPALASISNSCDYMGGISRAKFYAELLPQLETVHIGSRHFVVVASMDRLIAKMLDKSTANDHPTKRHRRSSPKSSGASDHTEPGI